MQTGVYVPIVTGEWKRGSNDYAFFVAPLAKAGFTTLIDQTAAPAAAAGSATSTSALPLTGQFYTSYSYGARIGVFQTFKKGLNIGIRTPLPS